MDRSPEISKAAFISRVNQKARVDVVDAYYKHRIRFAGGCVLMLVYSDGTEKPFEGLRAA